MTIDEKALEAACDAWAMQGQTLFTRRDKVRCVIEAYEAAKQSNLLAMLQSPEVVDKVADDLASAELLKACQYSELANAALAAITSFIEGDASTRKDEDWERAEACTTSPTSYAGHSVMAAQEVRDGIPQSRQPNAKSGSIPHPAPDEGGV